MTDKEILIVATQLQMKQLFVTICCEFKELNQCQ